MRYEGQKPGDRAYAMGTGWLIAPDTLVTAGHNVYDWSGYGTGLGRAVHIKAYIGYHGKKNLNSPIVQSRLAKNIVTTAEWLTSRDNRHRDVAIIQLDRPFTGDLRLFSYKPTPSQADEMIGVVGYPADKVLADEDGPEERGAMMYEEFGGVAYSLEKNKTNPLGMLKYRISTFGGQSGAPVLRKSSKLVAIGTHVYGGGDKNQAGVIGGHGNNYDELRKALTGQLPAVGEYHGIKLVKQQGAALTTSPSTPAISYNQNGFTPQASTGLDNAVHDAEGFLDVLKTIGGVVGNILPTVSPLLGPFGGPIAAVAGSVLNNLTSAAESAFDGADPSKPVPGATERAILAEASLQAVLKLPSDNPVTHKVINQMRTTYTNLAPNLKDITPKLTPALVHSAHAISSSTSYAQKNLGPRRTLPAQALPGVNHAEAAFGGSDFLNGMLAPAKPLEGEAEAFGFLGGLIEKGLSFGKPLLAPLAKQGLNYLGGLLGESAFAPESGFANDDLKAAELVGKRALLGEAALQAVSALRRDELEGLKVVSQVYGAEEESFFDFARTVAQKIGTVVKQAAPGVIKAVVPIIVDVVAGSKQNGAPAERFLGVAPAGTLRKKPSSSILDELNNGGLSNGILKVSALGPPAVVDRLATADRLELLRNRMMAEGPDPNEDKLVFVEY
ncbi:hypothetical protein B0H67DRAFT_483186 [Lasiosphaeris hirsuta]|uniref:Serine protease n=1 Tax=Lasiosphaeris hirsuta TaxID=260670 RepID=A0AA40AYM5_9PEZI|nr:hypothetical protein B0H67DRAFT_483186 [Lasiosphaeris hirsuta]